MRVCDGGGGCARGHYSAHGLLLSGAPQPQASDPSLDAQRAQLERVLAATTTVIFVASVSRHAQHHLRLLLHRQQQPSGDGGETWPQAQRLAAAAEDTKRALEEIPVVVAQDPAGVSGSGGAGAAEDGEEAARERAVCQAEYVGGEEVRVLPACRQGFHRECVDRWQLTRTPTCPVCRAPVSAHAEGPTPRSRLRRR